jgi:predicted nuclease of predicted toxin-antitoxin system
VRLLLDENLSPRLIPQLASAYPDSLHVEGAGLRGQTDEQIWSFARDSGYVLVSKDSDFRDLSAARGAPPKVVWLNVGNAGTTTIRDLLVANAVAIAAFVEDDEEAILVLVKSGEES